MQSRSIFRGVSAVLIGGLVLTACDLDDAEARRQRLHLPPLGFQGNATDGKSLYDQQCVTCHGQYGEGSDQAPALVHRVYASSHHADLAFHLAVRDGVKQHHWHFGDMPPLPDLSPEATEHIVVYMRQLQRQAGIQ